MYCMCCTRSLTASECVSTCCSFRPSRLVSRTSNRSLDASDSTLGRKSTLLGPRGLFPKLMHRQLACVGLVIVRDILNIVVNDRSHKYGSFSGRIRTTDVYPSGLAAA